VCEEVNVHKILIWKPKGNRQITKPKGMRDFRLPPRSIWDMHSSGILRSV